LDSDWENKVAIKNTKLNKKDLLELLYTKYKLSPVKSLNVETSKFSSFCLYTRFVLGKDLLLNVSIEQDDEGNIVAFVRMRS